MREMPPHAAARARTGLHGLTDRRCAIELPVVGRGFLGPVRRGALPSARRRCATAAK
jgi:hypothetical protein